MNEKTVPYVIWIIVLCWALSATIYAVASAAVNFQVKVPIVADLTATPSDLKIESVTLNYNAYTNRFDNVTFEIRNSDAAMAHAGTVTVKLYSADNTEIASGTVGTGVISPGVRVGGIVVQLTWTTGYSADDFSRGRVTLSQTS